MAVWSTIGLLSGEAVVGTGASTESSGGYPYFCFKVAEKVIQTSLGRKVLCLFQATKSKVVYPR
jgi:hypothetical protein